MVEAKQYVENETSRCMLACKKREDFMILGDSKVARKYFNNSRSEMLRFVPHDCRFVLEVGCGEGLFGKSIIERQKAEVWGIEPNKEASSKAKQNLTKVLNAEFNTNANLPTGYFDCVIFNDVLEHMYDPWAAVTFTKTLLRNKDSVVVMSVPNFATGTISKN